MRPVSDLEFYADVLRSGTVLGLDVHSTPEQVAAVLGTDFGEYRTRGARRCSGPRRNGSPGEWRTVPDAAE